MLGHMEGHDGGDCVAPGNGTAMASLPGPSGHIATKTIFPILKRPSQFFGTDFTRLGWEHGAKVLVKFAKSTISIGPRYEKHHGNRRFGRA